MRVLVGNLPVSSGIAMESSADFEYQPKFQIDDGTTYSPGEVVDTSTFYCCSKRLMDIALSSIALLVFTVLMLPVIAVAIKIDSPGSVFFRQQRVGINRRRLRKQGYTGTDRRKILLPGCPFSIFKLRTMYIDAEADGPQWASADDPRVTRVGRILRRTRLDEAPQFFNVLRGEMSLIGPRPERLCFIRKLEKTIPHYQDRLHIKPGITGLAQTQNGYDRNIDTVRRKVELDCLYIKNPSIITDLSILISTVRVVFTGDGAH